MKEERNLALAIFLSVLVIMSWGYFFPKAQVAPVQTSSAPPPAPVTPKTEQVQSTEADHSAALFAHQRVRIETPELLGSIDLVGGRLDDLSLTRFHETTDPESSKIVLFSPPAGAGAYYAEFGWVTVSDSQIILPDNKTVWRTSQSRLTPDQSVTLSWDNGHGLRFLRTFSVDQESMFTLTEKVENTGKTSVTLFPFALISRWGIPVTENLSVLHEGPIGVIDGSLKEYKYKKLREDEHLVEAKTNGGWLGITDKYWLAALLPDQTMPITTRFGWSNKVNGLDRYQTDWLGSAITADAGKTIAVTSHLFTGAKELSRLDSYGKELHIPRFDLAIDFGWFYFLTKPFFYILKMLHTLIPNFGIVIIVFTIIIRGLLFPIANKQYKSMAKMKTLQPEIKSIQERFAEDKMRQQQETMALYKREGVNPVAGCLPVLLQIPVMFALYKVLYVTLEMRQAPFFGWIQDLSMPDPTTMFNLFGLIPWVPPDMLHLGAWPLAMGLTMYLQQKLSPTPMADPVQARIMSLLPIIFTFMFAKMPAGLVIYWTWGNILSIAQQWLITKQQKT